LSQKISPLPYESGLIETELLIKEGRINGLEKRWYDNGKLCSEQNYKNGILDGLCRYYRKNGQIVSELKYKFKDEDLKYITRGGPMKVNLLNRAIGYPIAVIGEYTSIIDVDPTILDGTQKEWFENGKIKSIQNYTNGKKDGIQQFYFENGFIKSEENWKNDKLESKKCWDKMCIMTICK
jgi:antitoxin component YwqK of YwqJK toxin-antitoxin module